MTATITANETLVRRMVDAYCNMDGAAIGSVLHPNARHTAPGSDFGTEMEGRDKIVDYFRTGVFPSFERVQFDVVHLFEDQPRSCVVVEWRSHLWPKTGKNYSNTGAFVIEIKDGMVYWVREYFDTQKAHANVT